MKKIIATLAVITILTNAANAQASDTSAKSLTIEPLNVKYIGAEDDYLVFEITVNSTQKLHPVLNIDDKNAGLLYSETFKENTEVQTVKIEKKEDQALSFELVTDKATYHKDFNVNTSTIEKITVQESGIVTRY